MNAFKVSIIIIIVISTIFGGSILSSKTLKSSSDFFEKSISDIEENILITNWNKAKNDISTIKINWDNTKNIWTLLIDHIEIDNIDDAMIKLEKYIDTQNISLAVAEAARLKQYIKHIPDKESFELKNIL